MKEDENTKPADPDHREEPAETPARNMLTEPPPVSRSSAPSWWLGRGLFGASNAQKRAEALKNSLDWLPDAQRFEIIQAELIHGKDGLLPVEDLLDVMGLWGNELSPEDVKRVIDKVKSQDGRQ